MIEPTQFDPFRHPRACVDPESDLSKTNWIPVFTGMTTKEARMRRSYMKGFTLIELLLSISITGLLAVGISDFYITVVASKVKTQNIAAIEQQGASALQYIVQLTRNAESITLPTTGTSSSSLTLDVVDTAKDPTIIDISAGRLRIREGTSAPQYLTDSHTTVSNPVFNTLSRSSTPGVLRISFTLTSNSQSSVYEYTFSQNFASSASLR